MKDMYSQQTKVIHTLKRKLHDYEEESHIPLTDRIKELFSKVPVEDQRALLPSLKRCFTKKRKLFTDNLRVRHGLHAGQVYRWNLFTDDHPFIGWYNLMYDNVPGLWMDKEQFIRIIALTNTTIRWQYLFVDTTHPNRTGGTHYILRQDRSVCINQLLTTSSWQHRGTSFQAPPPLRHNLFECPLFTHGSFRSLEVRDSFNIITE